jgi:membrane protein required for colicin V production
MNFIDLILAIPLLWFAYKGFTKGLILELASLIALLLGIYIAGHFSDYTAGFLRDKMDFHSKYMSIISFSITFLVVIVLVFLFGKALEKVAHIALLGFANKFIGALFGLLKAIFLLSALIYIMDTLGAENKAISPKLQEGSLLYKPIKVVAPAVFPIIKESKINILDQIDEGLDDLRDGD